MPRPSQRSAPRGFLTAASGLAVTLAATLTSPADADPRLVELAAAKPDVVRILRPLATDPAFVVAAIGRGEGPGVLIVGGLHGRHAIGVDAAVGVAEAMAADPDALNGHILWVVPRVVPDGLPSGRADVPDDADHDGRYDEDAPRDLNGDGVIGTMIVEDPSPLTGLVATHVVDEDDPRIVRPAEDGEAATHAVLAESIDADGDGSFGEDAGGGIDVNSDFPALWPEFSDGVAAWPLSLPRTRALARWMINEKSLSMVIAHAPGDTLTAVPTDRGTGPAGRVPKGILSADEDAFEVITEAFRDATGLPKGDRNERAAGSLDAWAYGHLGLWSGATPLWDRPDRMGELATPPGDAEEAPDVPLDSDGDGLPDEVVPADQIEAAPVGDSDEAKWLAWIDAERGGEGFTDWAPFDHPQLGRVMIGGFHPDLPITPPTDLTDGIVQAQVAFVRDILAGMPTIEIARVDVRDAGNGLYDVAVVLENSGEIPTRPAIASRARRLTPTLVRLSVSDAHVIAGQPLRRIESIAPNEPETLRWRVRTDDPNAIVVTVTDPIHGTATATATAGEEN